MIYLFTYHRVRENGIGPGGSDFYTITPAQLDRQLAALAAKGSQPLNAQELLQRAPTEGGYLLSFDDGTIDHYDVVFPLLEKHGCKGIYFIPTSKLNKPGYMTNAQVQKLAAAGQVIGFHSHEHRRLDILPKEEIRRQISLSQKIIADVVGTKPVIFSPPGGFINSRIRTIAVDEGVQAIRTMRWGYNREMDLTALETIPINRYTDDTKFEHILEKQSSHLLYTAKETLKRLLPLRSYERLRGMLFKFSKPD